jgi:hypothetical protein
MDQSYIGTGAGLFNAAGAGASSAGLGRGSGVDDAARRCCGTRGWPKWSNHVASAESGDCASGAAADCAWAWAGAPANSRQIRWNATVRNAVTCIVFPPTVTHGSATWYRRESFSWPLSIKRDRLATIPQASFLRYFAGGAPEMESHIRPSNRRQAAAILRDHAHRVWPQPSAGMLPPAPDTVQG